MIIIIMNKIIVNTLCSIHNGVSDLHEINNQQLCINSVKQL